ncbi:NAD(P)/FAD-dependent oxidoreductase [Cryobacterium tepidiphilum]|uniref:NAD(P)/FAD-dependent oxidoreductase n=1 Tax=Cryobacterium tepidiphilum TaxID=2486026 RepID=A0A3M8L1S0_9MICO|nr:NAD(P)/FAD-dependent oxidoreductase [Cryobacterium tepidiphilum]RNE59316.1 NAD(P)/FAD-dependent oxidoreductase [Cryobacterium tepidiphilum]
MTEHVDALVIGAGPAGLAASLSLVRARRSVLLVDSNRPRNSATLHAHGFITRDGISPLELRRLGRAEFESYPGAAFHSGLVRSVLPADEAGDARFTVTTKGMRGEPNREVTAQAVLIATGLVETLPALPSIRAWYGTNLHSCIDCDGYEKADAALALIGESSDLAERAFLLSQWSRDLMVFTNGVGEVTAEEEAALRRRGISVDRRAIRDIVGEQGAMTGVELEDGEVIQREGGFVRPQWTPAALSFLQHLPVETDADGLILVDDHGRTSVPGLYAAGDSIAPGAGQLMVAAGTGARTAAAVNRDLLGSLLDVYRDGPGD